MMTASPCCRALRLARTLPALVRGPLLRRPLLRFTVVLRSELMAVLISRNYEAPSLEGAGGAPSSEVPFTRSRSGNFTVLASSRCRGLVRRYKRRRRYLFAIGLDLFIFGVDDLIGNLTQTLAQAFAVMLEQFEGLVEPHHCRGAPPVQLLLESATLFQSAVVFEFCWSPISDLVDILNCGLEFVFETNQLGDVGGLSRHCFRLFICQAFFSSILRAGSLCLKRETLLVPALDA